MALWLCRAGRFGEQEQKFLDESKIYLCWSGLSYNLTKFKEMKELYSFLPSVYPGNSLGRNRNYTGQLWTFSNRMQPGDWVALPSKRKSTIHIGEITGDYKFVKDGEDPYHHYRTVNWLEKDIPRTNFDQDILYSLGACITICRIKRNDAEARVRAMQGNNWKSAGIQPVLPQDDGDDDSLVEEVDIEQIASDQITRLIASKYKGHGLEALVDAILKAQGFTTYRTGKGADGGIDILAAPGTLGFGRPRICVQVKSQDSPVSRPVFDQLIGTMQKVQADQGLLVAWGGFKPTVKKEIPTQFFNVRLWDQTDLIEQFLANYSKLDEDIQADVPLKRVWVVTPQETDE